VAVCAVFIALVSVPLILAGDPLLAAPPVKPVPVGAVQVYVVPAGTKPLVPFTGVTVNPAALHTAEVIGVIAGFGFTVTVMLKVPPEQLPDFGVTV
jgi:hypothetical protein